MYALTEAELHQLYVLAYQEEEPMQTHMKMGNVLPSLLKMRSPSLFSEKWVNWCDVHSTFRILHCAVELTDSNFVDMLLDKVPAYRNQIPMSTNGGNTVFSMTAATGNLEMMRILNKWNPNGPRLCFPGHACASAESMKHKHTDMSILLLKYDRDAAFVGGCHLGMCYDRTPQTEKYMTQCLKEMHHRLKRAYSTFMVFLALSKRVCHPDVWKEILRPMLKELWCSYNVFPCWK